MGEDEITAIERRLASLWMNVLNVDAIARGTSFVALGGDWRAAKLAINEIGLAFNIRLAPDALLEHDATLRRVASVIEDELNAGPLNN